MKTHFLAMSSLIDTAFFGSTVKLLEELSVTLRGRDKMLLCVLTKKNRLRSNYGKVNFFSLRSKEGNN